MEKQGIETRNEGHTRSARWETSGASVSKKITVGVHGAVVRALAFQYGLSSRTGVDALLGFSLLLILFYALTGFYLMYSGYSLSSRTKPEKTGVTTGFPENWLLGNEREYSILVILGSASDWLKICFVQSDTLPRQYTVNQKICFSTKNGAVSVSKIQSDPRAEMDPSVDWRTLLIELFWPKLCSNGSRRGWIGHCSSGLNWHFGAETDLLNFQCTQVVTHGHRGISPLVPQTSFRGETPGGLRIWKG